MPVPVSPDEATPRRRSTSSPAAPDFTPVPASRPAVSGTASGSTGQVKGPKAPARKAPAKAPVKAPAKAARTAPAATSTTAAGTAGRGSVVVVPDRTKYHLSGCRFVRDVPGAQELTRRAASSRGYAPCGVCKP